MIRMKKKTYKIIWAFISLIIIVSAVVAFVELRYYASVDLRFTRALERGVYNSLALQGSELDLRTEKGEKDLSFIDAEYEAVKPFKGAQFNDKNLEAAAKDYIGALSECSEVIQKNDPKKYKSFWSAFSKPYGHRLQSFYNLYQGGYRFEFEEVKNDVALEDELEEILLQGWALTKTESIQFSYKKGEEKQNLLVAEIENDSGYDLEYLDVTVELYDSNRKHLETVSAFKNDIKAGETIDLYCYETEPGSAKNYNVTAINCVRKSLKNTD